MSAVIHNGELPCASCGEGKMRLVRFEGGHDIWGCRSCIAETPLLDCHFCERRAVHHLAPSAEGQERWGCAYCGVKRERCPSCSRGWGYLQGRGDELVCGECNHQWEWQG